MEAGASLSSVLMDLKANGRKALVAYTMAGDPNPETTVAAMGALSDAGADALELGLPFSDPVADGPVIQEASIRALGNGTDAGKALGMVAGYRNSRHRQVPLVLMTYLNPVLAYGAEGFATDARQAGANGIIVPDLPPEESGMLGSGEGTLDRVLLTTPTSTDQRLRVIGAESRGFVYMVSVAGVTGTRRGIPGDLAGHVARIRRYTDLPVLVGFGIETPGDAAEAARISDGVVIGSAVVKRLRDHGPKALGGYIDGIRNALDA